MTHFQLGIIFSGEVKFNHRRKVNSHNSHTYGLLNNYKTLQHERETSQGGLNLETNVYGSFFFAENMVTEMMYDWTSIFLHQIKIQKTSIFIGMEFH